jgi:TolA-binding protein
MNKKILLLLALSITLLPGCFKTRADIAKEKEEKELRASLQQNVVESNQGVERLQAEIGRLNGKIEELEFQRKQEMSAYGTSRDSSDKSVAEMKTRMEEMQKTQTMLFEELKRLKEENVQLLKSMDRPRAAPAPAPGQKKSAKANSFSTALTAFKAKDYEAATSGFRSFLEMNPKSKKALDARFMLADSLYRQKEYTDAIMEFSVIHEKTPTTSLGRKSTLKIAESFKALGKDKDARTFAQILQSSSPNSAEAKQARKFLK